MIPLLTLSAGPMLIHRAVFNRDIELIKKLVEEGTDVNEVGCLLC